MSNFFICEMKHKRQSSQVKRRTQKVFLYNIYNIIYPSRDHRENIAGRVIPVRQIEYGGDQL